jgi:hypothetical protein
MYSGWQATHPVASRPAPAPDPAAPLDPAPAAVIAAGPAPAAVTAAGPALCNALGPAPSQGGEGGRGPEADGAALDRRGWRGVPAVRCSTRRR